MKQMNLQPSRGVGLHYGNYCSIAFARNQVMYIHHLMWCRVMGAYHFNPAYEPASPVLPRQSVGYQILKMRSHQKIVLEDMASILGLELIGYSIAAPSFEH